MLMLDLWYFKISLCLVLILCSVMAKENMVKDKKCCKTKPGYVKLKTGESKDIQTMEVSVDGRAENVEMKKKKLPLLSKPPSEKNKDVSMYVSSDGSMACMKECKRKSTECKAQCLQKNNKGYTYVSEDNAMDIEPNDKLIMDFADINRSYRDRIDALKRQANRNQRERRETEMPNLVVPNLNNDTATLKIKLVIDDSVMDIFQDFVGGNATKAQYEAEKFFTLAMNTVAMYFPSVSEWGFSFKTFDDVTKPVDLAVWLHSIDFPSMENNEFDSIEPIKNSNENETLISRLYFDENGNYLGDTGLWVEFALYMRQECNGSTSFNHLQVITGRNIIEEYYIKSDDGSFKLEERVDGIIGFAASVGALCENYAMFNFDLRFSFVQMFAPEFTRVMVHEIGHIAGAFHDGLGCCDDEIYVMNSTSFPKLPDFSLSFYKFSSCSAKDFGSYLSSFTINALASCVYTSNPKEEEFLFNFCKGLLGSEYGLETHCKIFTDGSGSVCPNGDYTFVSGYLPWDGCEPKLLDGIYHPIFRCTDENGCGNTNYDIYHIFEGTKCLNVNGTKGDQVCYRGKCRSKIELCEEYE